LPYTPEPIDTSTISLTAEHLQLAEVLAQHSHDTWAKQHLEQGWGYGSQFDAAQRRHPHLVPYAELPDEAKQAQAITVLTTLKTLFALGYQVIAREGGNLTIAPEEQQLTLILQNLQTSSHLDLATLLDLQRKTIRLQPRTPELYHALGHSILQLGEPLMAYDVLAQGLKNWAQDLRLQQLLALALARSGATVAANSLLSQLVQTGQQDEETLGLLARTHKDLWLQATDPTLQAHHLRLATERYLQAYQLTGSIWTGINAATLAKVMGRTDQASALAITVRTHCLQKLQADPDRPDYWLLATLGEAALILGQWSEAEDFYGKAIALGKGRFGDLSSSRRNALLLAQPMSDDVQRIQRWFQIPRVVVFCGHMIDRPDRSQPRFPAELEPVVYHAIRDRLRQLDARLGYASAACGADILFLEALRELEGELHIVLPSDRESFIQDSVDLIPGANWRQRFEHLMEQATEVIIASGKKQQTDGVEYEYSNRLLHGLAKMRAEQLGTDLIPLTVWDGQAGDGKGGTASTVEHWQQWTDYVEVIDLKTLLQSSLLTVSQAPAPPNSIAPDPALANPAAQTLDRQIRALLFADVVNYSQLTEEQYLPFAQHFLGTVADLSRHTRYQPLMKNTWGDALYYVFPTVQQAGQFALDLCDLIQSVDWPTKGLPSGLNLRIALHAGPVERNIDPITGQINYIGTHVNHTARIEPITPPGKVYASQAFAAIAASEGLKTFACDYVGKMPWAKRYGTFPTYHIRRSGI
jgi:class 3 adenylate cyclase/tetratricopeptide (TPR) repeat protein